MAAVSVRESVPVEVRAAELRERVLADMARVEQIGDELARIDEEIRTVTAFAVADNPIGELRAGPRSMIRKLTDQRDGLANERDEIERLLPYRSSELKKLDEECLALGVEELKVRRAVIVDRTRSALALVAAQFEGMVATYAGEFREALGELQAFHADVRARGIERVDGLIGSPVGAVPTDVMRLCELLASAAGILQSNPSPEFVEVCAFDAGLAEDVRTARLEMQFTDLPVTSWVSAHGEAV